MPDTERLHALEKAIKQYLADTNDQMDHEYYFDPPAEDWDEWLEMLLEEAEWE